MTKDFIESCYYLSKIEEYKKKIEHLELLMMLSQDKKTSKIIKKQIDYYEDEIQFLKKS